MKIANPEGVEFVEPVTVPTATADGHALNRQTADARYAPLGAAGGLPAGVMMTFGGAAAPAGWLLCDGSLVSRSMYAALFATVGTAFGAGDGANTFGLPDLRQRFPRGRGASDTLGATGGAATHTHADHAALSHAGAAVADHAALAHSGTAVADHVALAHAGTAVANHAAGTTGQASAGATARGSTASTLTLATHTHSTPSLAHTVTQSNNHAAQAHSVTQPSDHVAQGHAVTQPSNHAAQTHDLSNSEPPFVNLNWIIKT
jgi:microcystin-dependent protein